MSFFLSLVFVCCPWLLLGTANGITNLADVSCGQQLIAYQPKINGELREKMRQPRIINGTDAYKGEYPWIVSIKFRATNSHFCGGSLIHKRYVVSAAHCFADFKDGYFSLNKIKVTLAEHDLSEKEGTIDKSIEKLIFHEGFRMKGFVNDIVLLKLDTDVIWSPYIRPVCLPSSDNESKLFHFMGTVAGWGHTADEMAASSEENIVPYVLQKVDVPILDNEECRRWFKSNNVNSYPLESQICAGYQEGGKDACQGDSGGGLTISLEKLQKVCLVGIVSAGRGCARPLLPGVYTRVSNYVDWIQSKITG